MNVPPISTTNTGTTNTTNAAQTVDYQSFLRLLVAQMKNQDPTSPMESTDYVAQLATFSQVEQSVQMNNRLEQILQASTFSQAGDLIGREIESADGKIKGKVESVRLFSDGIMAILDNGEQLPVWAGVIIR
ncbi:flagellar hook assembly protein FlgD [Aquamicrobium sp. LC103]|uniref:flagellar hook assembly protein FlgD n=1 Tax=Aquamicrobium sp. LC103 TaxID=1120658 RepID=UPI00063EA7CA|nr:flagellar hook assembly protein FlgD [Aquamicrobium sp. LC103]TKT77503.1 flagellar hook assembly protein FlgD [Aquamicrobium sp. LC103]